MKDVRRTLSEAGWFVTAGLVWAAVIASVALLALVCGIGLLARYAWRVLLAWPERVESRSDREARLLDPHASWLHRGYDMDAELAELIAEEEARQRRAPDSGSVRGWMAVAGALLGIAICAVGLFVLVVLGKAGLQ